MKRGIVSVFRKRDHVPAWGYLPAGVMAVFIPVLTLAIQAVVIVLKGENHRRILLSNPFCLNFWILLGAESAITFLVLWFVIKFPVLRGMAVIGLIGVWLYVASLLEATTR